jgi:hypothetical protein
MRGSKFTASQVVEILQAVEGGLPMPGTVTVTRTSHNSRTAVGSKRASA